MICYRTGEDVCAGGFFAVPLTWSENVELKRRGKTGSFCLAIFLSVVSDGFGSFWESADNRKLFNKKIAI
jgi:hypothetical protein